eukprot:GILK01010954.1.p1 GENE.GILK01010954.1~~GILK01010954.1.p1  ORF type:complete len:564 (-),score=52.11 GILK01010954.1:19-1710(-)
MDDDSSDGVVMRERTSSLSFTSHWSQMVLSQVLGNFITLAIVSLLYFNYMLFQEYFNIIFWAFLVSSALRSTKAAVVKELHILSKPSDESLIRCLVRRWILERDYDVMSVIEYITNHAVSGCMLAGVFAIGCRLLPIKVALIVAGLVLFALLMLVLLDRKVFLIYRLVASDDTLVTAILLVSLLVIGAFVVIFFFVQCIQEGILAANGIASWVDEHIIQNEDAQKIWKIGGENFVLRHHLEEGKDLAQDWMRSFEVWANSSAYAPVLNRVIDAARNISDARQAPQSLKTVFFGQDATAQDMFSMVYMYLDELNVDLQTLLKHPIQFIHTSTEFLVGTGSHIVISLIRFIFLSASSIIDSGFRVFLFLTCLFYSLQTSVDFLDQVARLLPEHNRSRLLSALRESIEGVFVLPIQICIRHAVVTWLSCWLLSVDFVYFATFLTSFFSLFPFVPPIFSVLPWFLYLLAQQHVVKAILLLVTHYLAFAFIDATLYERLPESHVYATGLSMVMGLYVFGLQGIFVGPLLVCAVTIAFKSLAPRSDLSRRNSRSGLTDFSRPMTPSNQQ